jgi:mRNA-degrading endonuclease YafQ of YafQ-DinJ toxin-antitoxin module
MDFKPKYLLQDRTFKKTFNKYRNNLSETDRNKLRKLFEIFRENAFDSKLRTHKLKGALSDYYAFSISYSDRIVFRILDDGGVLLVDIGSHDEVY